MTTAEHPFYAQNRGWTKALDLKPGDLLLGMNGETNAVQRVHSTDREATVYNFRVADHHTYFVGSPDWGFDVWVHNTYKVSTDGLSIIDDVTGRVFTVDPTTGKPFPKDEIGKIAGEWNRLAAVPISIPDGLARSKTIRGALDAGKGKTVAFAEVSVSKFKGEVVAVSGEADRGGLVGRFETTNPGSTVAPPTARSGVGRQDAEVKILDYLRTVLDPSDRGTIRLFVDQPQLKGVCENCTIAIAQFKKDFPHIKLIPSSP